MLGQFDRSLVWGFFLEAKKVPKAAKGSEERQREANMNKNKQRETKRKTEQQFQSISNFKKVVALPVPCSDRFMLELFFALFLVLFWGCFFVWFWEAFGCHFGSILGAKIDPSRAKFGPRWLLKRYFLKKVNFHENL